MSKPIEKDGKFYRMRRGKLVEIPPEWKGRTVSRQTINARPSKAIHKRRKQMKHGYRHPKGIKPDQVRPDDREDEK